MAVIQGFKVSKELDEHIHKALLNENSPEFIAHSMGRKDALFRSYRAKEFEHSESECLAYQYGYLLATQKKDKFFVFGGLCAVVFTFVIAMLYLA